MSNQRILAKIKARAAAKEIAQLLEWEDGTGADFAESFLKEMRELLPVRRVAEKPKPKEIPFAQLEATVLEFGEHAGKSFAEVPEYYLDWLCREQESFLPKLQSYLRGE